MAEGKIYSSKETDRIKEFLGKEQELLGNQENSKDNTNQTILRYGLLVGGSAIVLLLLNFVIKKNS
jgi:hypothetical protein